MTTKEAEAILDAAVLKLGEHFEAVQVLSSWPKEGGEGTYRCYRGNGNWFARQGMAHEFIGLDRASEIAHKINEEGKS